MGTTLGAATPRARLTPRQERVLIWLISVNALLLLLAPISGATIIHGIRAVLSTVSR
jgi:hypothetical protein